MTRLQGPSLRIRRDKVSEYLAEGIEEAEDLFDNDVFNRVN